jgi:hypothetical protein
MLVVVCFKLIVIQGSYELTSRGFCVEKRSSGVQYYKWCNSRLCMSLQYIACVYIMEEI